MILFLYLDIIQGMSFYYRAPISNAEQIARAYGIYRSVYPNNRIVIHLGYDNNNIMICPVMVPDISELPMPPSKWLNNKNKMNDEVQFLKEKQKSFKRGRNLFFNDALKIDWAYIVSVNP